MFPDLRIHSTSADEESFWPSFTDILTVVVIVFLLAMVVVLLKNTELVNRLTSTIESERAAALLAQSLGEAKDGLADQLLQTEERLARMQAQMEFSQRLERGLRAELSTAQNALLAERSNNAELSRSRDTLRQKVDDTTRQLQAMRTEASQSRDAFNQLQQSHTALTEQADTDRAAIQQARSELALRDQTLQASRSRLQSAEQSLSLARSEFDDLKLKYDQLIRPARSPAGKHIVEVQYAKRADAEEIKLRRDPKQNAATPISRAELDRALSELKDQYGEQLYIKIVFPKDSGLSYNEAWGFTRSLLYRYDYYYRDKKNRKVTATP